MVCNLFFGTARILKYSGLANISISWESIEKIHAVSHKGMAASIFNCKTAAKPV